MAGGKGAKASRSKGKKRPPAKRPPGAAARAGAGSPASSAGTPAPPGTPPPAAGGPKLTRAERLEAAQRARRRKAAITRAAIAGAIALVVLVVGAIVVVNTKHEEAATKRLTAGSCTYDTKADKTSSTGQKHVPPASYEVDPPAGGNHTPEAAVSGDYSGGDDVPTDFRIVHALEHGYVTVWYRPDLGEQELAAVRKPFDRYPDDVLVVPRASLGGKVAATAWGRRLLCTDVEPAQLTEFVRLYRNKGPEKVPHT
ncbi:MAG TPA: DUF3105 domain-containing protein [Acidimicrobiales bacterium]|nr:DUF3105 domain-containing protein [Acidimicrobiales bacterium]